MSGPAKSNTKTRSYEKLKSELDSILAELQGDDLDIDQALKRYERGLELIKSLEEYLASAENTVSELKARFDKKG